MTADTARKPTWLTAWESIPDEPVYFSDDPQVWRVLQSFWEHGTITFRYWGGLEPGAVRSIVPRRVFRKPPSPVLYFSGVCPRRGAIRTFSFDRVDWEIESSAVAASPPGTPNPATTASR